MNLVQRLHVSMFDIIEVRQRAKIKIEITETKKKLAGNVKTLKQHRDFSKSSSQSETLLHHAWSHIMFRIPYYVTIIILMFSEATTNTSILVNRNSSICSVDKVQYTGASVICSSWDMSVKVFQIIVIIDFKYKALQTIDVSNARLC